MGAGNNPIFDVVFYREATYGAASATVTAATPVAVKTGGPGMLCRIVVLTAGTGTITFYDNPTTNSGTILFILPASPTVGAVYDIRLPFATGLYAQAAASSSSVAVSFL
jgi:hypothetical protein